MIVLDTNAVSETLRSRPHQSVLGWLNACTAADLFVTTVTEAEIRLGIARLDDGKRRESLIAAVDRAFETLLCSQVLSFDRDAARHYAEIAVHRYRTRRPISQFDCQIAAISRSRGAILVTRNVADFEGTGVAVINPWEVTCRAPISSLRAEGDVDTGAPLGWSRFYRALVLLVGAANAKSSGRRSPMGQALRRVSSKLR